MSVARLTRSGWWLAAMAIAALAVAASWRGLGNGFAYDDLYIVEHNARVHSLDGILQAFRESYWPKQWATDGYRPLTIIAFALQWAAGDGAPRVFHAVSIVLYAATCVLAFRVASLVLPHAWAFVAGALFAVHPVHVEAVANIVGQSELVVGALLLLATALFIAGRREGPVTPARWAAIYGIYVVACLFKEHALVLPAVLLLAEVTVVRDARPLGKRLVEMRLAMLSLALLAVSLLALRTIVHGGVSGFRPFYPFLILKTTTFERLLTVLNVVPEWVRLLVWPARLAIDYTPNEIEIATGLSASQLPGLLLLAGILALGVISARRVPVAAFGIGFLALTLLPASNLLIPAGIVVAERTLFLPSLGALLAAVAALPLAGAWLRAHRPTLRTAPLAWGVVTGALVLGLWRSNTRTPAWRDNLTLFATDAAAHPGSYRINYLMGAWYYTLKNKRLGEPFFLRSLTIFPYDPQVAFRFADGYSESGLWEPAAKYYRWALRVQPDYGEPAYVSLATAELALGNREAARATALEGMRRFGATPFLRRAYRAASTGAARRVPAAGATVSQAGAAR